MFINRHRQREEKFKKFKFDYHDKMDVHIRAIIRELQNVQTNRTDIIEKS